ncbi:MAG: helix-turn-helix transcriptional regulator [Gammaproteobacteria bacterium]|nr:helix-turn-helix transcriptional regulator [Gammaproteobacteria bacterium]
MKNIQPGSTGSSEITIRLFNPSTEDNRYVSGQSEFGRVIFCDFETIMPIPNGAVDIDTLIEGMSQDPEMADAISEARAWVAESFYTNKSSLKILRMRAGFSQKQLALTIGTSQSHIAKIENGIADPQIETLKRIAKALSIETYKLCAVMVGEKIE